MIDIAISGLVKEFEVGKKILDGLTFQVDSGERVRSNSIPISSYIWIYRFTVLREI